MARHTKKLGVVGKYGTRYGAALRKVAKKIEISQRAKYTCMFCGKVCFPLHISHFQDSMKRTCVGIWKCKACLKAVAGGAWSVRFVSTSKVKFSTMAGTTARSTIRRLREQVNA